MLLRILMYVGLYFVGYLITAAIMLITLYKVGATLANRYSNGDKISSILAISAYMETEKPLIGKRYNSALYAAVFITLWPIMMPMEMIHIILGWKKTLIED